MAFRIERKKSTRKDLRKLPHNAVAKLSRPLKIWRPILFRMAWKN